MGIIEKNVVTDIDGNSYNGVQIGTQFWLVENLNVTRYRNGDKLEERWVPQELGACFYYKNREENGKLFGKLYNWYAISDPRGLAPEGYHIPTDEEWKILIEFLGGDQYSLENGYENEINKTPKFVVATEESGFKGLPGGYCNGEAPGHFSNIGQFGNWWSNSELGNTNSCIRTTNEIDFFSKIEIVDYYVPMNFNISLSISNEEEYNNKRRGFSVRCIRD